MSDPVHHSLLTLYIDEPSSCSVTAQHAPVYSSSVLVSSLQTRVFCVIKPVLGRACRNVWNINIWHKAAVRACRTEYQQACTAGPSSHTFTGHLTFASVGFTPRSVETMMMMSPETLTLPLPWRPPIQFQVQNGLCLENMPSCTVAPFLVIFGSERCFIHFLKDADRDWTNDLPGRTACQHTRGSVPARAR